MKIGAVISSSDPQRVIHYVIKELEVYHDVVVYQFPLFKSPIFYYRINPLLKKYDFIRFMHKCDVLFFDWASDMLAYATHLPKQCAIVTRLVSYELFQWAPKVNWDAVDKIILVSHAMQRRFVEYFPEHAIKTVVIYNGTSLNKFFPQADRQFQFNLGMLCSISPIKRVYEVIPLLFQLREYGFDATLHIAGKPAGDPRYEVALKRMINKFDLDSRVIFYGQIDDPFNWLKNIDIFISNSFWEGQQFALIEAMASGCFCLSHFWDGADEVLPKENLYLTESELLQKIVAYSQKSQFEKLDLQSQMRNIACEKFDIEHTKIAIRQMIDSM
ncbi:glycosyltransferase family 4 protein [Chloroflexota bacterium]